MKKLDKIIYFLLLTVLIGCGSASENSEVSTGLSLTSGGLSVGV